MSESRKEKTARPFYELPAHIKPCSRIIQETRLQLSYGGGKLPHNPVSLSSPTGGQGDSSFSRGSSSAGTKRFSPVSPGGDDGSYFDTIGRPGPAVPGIRAVSTQRPKTGIIDNDLLWGVSSRKRPPSAITLSRLSLDDSEDDRSVSSAGSLPRAANAALGAPLKLRQRVDLRSAGHKSLPTPESSIDLDPASPGTRVRDEVTEKLRFLSTKSETVGGTKTYRSPMSIEEVSPEGDEALFGAIKNLNSLVNPPSSEPPMKSEVISALQCVKAHISEVEQEPELKQKLLRLIFKLVERNQHDEDLIFWASFVLLHCKIMGNNLTTVFKMVFKASRSKDYWPIIQESEYLDVFMDSFGQICPLTQTESMIYGYGTLKFICMEKSVLLRIVELNLVPIMTLHLKLLNYELTSTSGRKGPKKIPEAIFNGVFQLTSILRAVVGEEATLHQVVSSGLLDQLCNSLSWTVDDVDILSNVVRILSVVSGDPLCCQLISSNDNFSSNIVKMIQMWHSKEDVVVRLTYCLGNLLAHCEGMRLKLFQEPNCYSMILHLISYYLERPPVNQDILIKSIRILANWSLNPSIGREICEDGQISDILNTVLKNHEFTDELLICVISTLNNITFYKDYNSTDVNTVQTSEYLCDYLTWKNIEGRTEVMKVLGNLTRNPVVREATAEHVDKLLLSMDEQLGRGQESEELLCATVGVLMNIIVDSRASYEFLSRNGVDLLLQMMETRTDIGLNLMICQFLWNVLISWENREDDLEEEEEEEEEEEAGDADGHQVGTVTVDKNNGSSSIMMTEELEAINEKQRLEIRRLIRRKLDSIDQLTNLSTEYPYLDLESEFRSVAARLFDKLEQQG